VLGARVLEAGIGEGYGANLLRRSGSGPVTGLDYDPSVTTHVARTYPGLLVVRGDLQQLPFRAGAFDAIVHLQTIEHLHDQAGFVADCARALRPAGTLIVSTPNRLTFSPGLDRPLNPFHTRELSALELCDLLRPHFEVMRMYGLAHRRRLRRMERRVGQLVSGQLAGPPASWPVALRDAVHRVRANDFDLSEGAIDASLDLVAIARRRA
jgi:SAM-dependent methyltransferase